MCNETLVIKQEGIPSLPSCFQCFQWLQCFSTFLETMSINFRFAQLNRFPAVFLFPDGKGTKLRLNYIATAGNHFFKLNNLPSHGWWSLSILEDIVLFHKAFVVLIGFQLSWRLVKITVWEFWKFKLWKWLGVKGKQQQLGVKIFILKFLNWTRYKIVNTWYKVEPQAKWNFNIACEDSVRGS